MTGGRSGARWVQARCGHFCLAQKPVAASPAPPLTACGACAWEAVPARQPPSRAAAWRSLLGLARASLDEPRLVVGGPRADPSSSSTDRLAPAVLKPPPPSGHAPVGEWAREGVTRRSLHEARSYTPRACPAPQVEQQQRRVEERDQRTHAAREAAEAEQGDVRADLAKILLTAPVCTSEKEKIALSRRIDKHWRLIGWGEINRGVTLEPTKA